MWIKPARKGAMPTSNHRASDRGRNCPLCGTKVGDLLFEVSGLPVFQNKVYADVEAAQQAVSGDIVLKQCKSCGFSYNAAFVAEHMIYDETYQNEQSHSAAFREHLNVVAELALDAAGKDAAILEIGCGKGAFLDVLRSHGVRRIRGFDPAYEGTDPAIVRDYFSKSTIKEPADLIVLRHTLEHVESPFEFLQMIFEANSNRGRILIEVPDFDWIIKNASFWDIYYEHCNYFTQPTLAALFHQSQTWTLFGGQYQCLIAEIADLKEQCSDKQPHPRHDTFPDRRAEFASQLEGDNLVFVWGASSKGVTFLNHLDPKCERIHALIDINPKKQGMFIPATGHRIRAPEYLDELPEAAITILVANPNYVEEIKARTRDRNAEYVCF